MYELARSVASNVIDDDEGRMPPPTVSAEVVDEALAAGYVLIDRRLLGDAGHEGDAFVAVVAADLFRYCVAFLLAGYGLTGGMDAAAEALAEAMQRQRACADPADEAWLFEVLQQAEAHFDQVS